MPLRIFRRLTDIHLEAECADRRVTTFVAEYEAITGIRLRRGRDFQVQPSANDNKRGLEGRVYFNATPKQVTRLLGLGLRVQGPRTRGYLSSKYSYRIDLNRLLWMLINDGYRL